MNIKFFSFFIILYFLMPTTQCVKPSKFLPPFIAICLALYTAPRAEASTNSHELPKQAKYDCQKLTAEYSFYEQLSQEKKDFVYDATLKEWLTVRSNYSSLGLRTYANKHRTEQEVLSDNLAALVCFGVNPNRVAVSNVSRSEAYAVFPAHETRDYLCAVDYAVETDNAELASFLIKHNAWTHTHVLTWFASVKDRFFGESPKYAWTITREKRDHLLLKIQSVAMAKLLAPHIGVDCTFAEKKNIVHHAAENNEFGIELLNYYLELEGKLTDKTDKYDNTPLHRLADTCHYAQYFPEVRENLDSKTTLLAQKTKNINALNAEGKTALDIALSKPVGCESFIALVKVYGGKSTSIKQRDNALRTGDYETVTKVLHEDYEILERE